MKPVAPRAVTCHICGTQYPLTFGSRQQGYELLTSECPACAGPIRFVRPREATVGIARGLLYAFTDSNFYRSYYGDPCAYLLQNSEAEETIDRIIAAAESMDYDLWEDDSDHSVDREGTPRRAASLRELRARCLDGTLKESLRACSEAAKKMFRDERREHLKVYQSRLEEKRGGG